MVTENFTVAKKKKKNGERTHLGRRRGGVDFHPDESDGDLRPAFACLRPGAERNGNKTDMLLFLKRRDAVSLS